MGPHVDVETLYAAKAFCSRFNANTVLVSDMKGDLQTDWDGLSSLNAGLGGIEESDCLLLVGVDLKQELPLLNARLRSSFLRDQTSMAHLGRTSDSGFPVPSAGLGIRDFEQFVKGKHSFCQSWASAKNPKILLSSSLFESSESDNLRSLLTSFTESTE
jgi:NADH dehydrogenase/NADH:ubiquinone oxidoreductase subunit G